MQLWPSATLPHALRCIAFPEFRCAKSAFTGSVRDFAEQLEGCPCGAGQVALSLAVLLALAK